MSDDLTEDEIESLSQAMGDSEQETASPVQTATEVKPREPSPEVPKGNISRAQFMQLEAVAEAADLPPQDLSRLYDIQVQVEVVLGSTRMPLEDVLKLHAGSVVELDKLAGEPVDLLANKRLVARAEVVVIEESFGVKIVEIVGTKQKLKVIQ